MNEIDIRMVTLVWILLSAKFAILLAARFQSACDFKDPFVRPLTRGASLAVVTLSVVDYGSHGRRHSKLFAS